MKKTDSLVLVKISTEPLPTGLSIEFLSRRSGEAWATPTNRRELARALRRLSGDTESTWRAARDGADASVEAHEIIQRVEGEMEAANE